MSFPDGWEPDGHGGWHPTPRRHEPEPDSPHAWEDIVFLAALVVLTAALLALFALQP